MTRKSKRELERQLADLNDGATTARTETPLKDRCQDPVVTLVYELCRELYNISYRHAPTVENAEEPAGTLAYIETVREHYDLDADRDDDVARGLVDVASESVEGWDPIDTFAMAPSGLAGRVDVTSDDGADLLELAVDGREADAKRLLVEAAFGLFATDDGRGVEVTA